MVEGGGFEPPKSETADLQSAPVGRLGIPPAQTKQGILQKKIYLVNVNLYFFYNYLL